MRKLTTPIEIQMHVLDLKNRVFKAISDSEAFEQAQISLDDDWRFVKFSNQTSTDEAGIMYNNLTCYVVATKHFISNYSVNVQTMLDQLYSILSSEIFPYALNRKRQEIVGTSKAFDTTYTFVVQEKDDNDDDGEDEEEIPITPPFLKLNFIATP